MGTPGFEAISPLWPLSPGKAIKLPFPASLKTRVSEIQFGTGVQRSRDFGIRINHMYSIPPSSWTSLPTPHPSSSSHSPELSFLCYTAGFHQLSILHMVVCVSVCVCLLVTQMCLTVCNPMDCSLSGFSVHGILQARILEWVAISFSERSSRPRDRTQVSYIAGRFFTI